MQAEVRANNNVFPSGFLMMIFGSCPTNGWSDVSSDYEGRFLKISSSVGATHDAVLPEHSHGVGFFLNLVMMMLISGIRGQILIG